MRWGTVKKEDKIPKKPLNSKTRLVGRDRLTGRQKALHDKLFRELRGEMWTRVLTMDGHKDSVAFQEIVEDSGLSHQTVRNVLYGHENVTFVTLESLVDALGGGDKLANLFHGVNRTVTRGEASKLRRTTRRKNNHGKR